MRVWVDGWSARGEERQGDAPAQGLRAFTRARGFLRGVRGAGERDRAHRNGRRDDHRLRRRDGEASPRGALGVAPRGPGEEEWAKRSALDRAAVDMVRSLLDFQRREGRYVDSSRRWAAPSRCGSRARARAPASEARGRTPRRDVHRGARSARGAGVELENFSASWLTELERFASLRAHRVTLHDPIALAAFEREQRELSFAGALSRARLLRLRQAGMKGLRCASGAAEDELLRGAPENRRPPLFGVHRRLAGQIETISMRENVLAAEAARAARRRRSARRRGTRASSEKTARAREVEARENRHRHGVDDDGEDEKTRREGRGRGRRRRRRRRGGYRVYRGDSDVDARVTGGNPTGERGESRESRWRSPVRCTARASPSRIISSHAHYRFDASGVIRRRAESGTRDSIHSFADPPSEYFDA